MTKVTTPIPRADGGMSLTSALGQPFFGFSCAISEIQNPVWAIISFIVVTDPTIEKAPQLPIPRYEYRRGMGYRYCVCFHFRISRVVVADLAYGNRVNRKPSRERLLQLETGHCHLPQPPSLSLQRSSVIPA